MAETYLFNPQAVTKKAPVATATMAAPPAPVTIKPPTPAAPPPLVTTAPSAPVPGQADTSDVVTTAGVYHDVNAPGDTTRPDYGVSIQSFGTGGAGYGTYGTTTQTPSVYTGYTAQQYGEPTTGPMDLSKYIGQVGGRSQFDWQREQIQGDYSAETQRQLEQLEATLAQQGITGGAAVAARNDLIRNIAMQKAASMNQVNQQESQYMSEAAMTEQAQRFSREERLGEQAFTGELTYAQLNVREQEIAENARQFDNKYDFDIWAKEQGFTEEEINRVWQATQNDADRNLNAQELQFKVDDMRNQLTIDYEQLKVTTGLERDKLLYNIWNTEQEIASTERRLQYQTWADQKLAQLESDLIQGRWDDQTMTTQRQTSYFNMGKAGVTLDDAQLESLKTQDPLAYYAYLDGQANLDQIVFQNNMDIRTSWWQASIASLADLPAEQFGSQLTTITNQFSQLFGPQGTFAGISLGQAGVGSYGSILGGNTATTATTGATVVGGANYSTGAPADPTSGTSYTPPLQQNIVNQLSTTGSASMFYPKMTYSNYSILQPNQGGLSGVSRTFSGIDPSGNTIVKLHTVQNPYGSQVASQYLGGLSNGQFDIMGANTYDEATLTRGVIDYYSYMQNGGTPTYPEANAAGIPWNRGFQNLLAAPDSNVGYPDGTGFYPQEWKVLDVGAVLDGTIDTERLIAGRWNIGGMPFAGSGLTWNPEGGEWEGGHGVSLGCVDDPRVAIMVSDRYEKPQLVVPQERLAEFQGYGDQFDIVIFEDNQAQWVSDQAYADFHP